MRWVKKSSHEPPYKVKTLPVKRTVGQKFIPRKKLFYKKQLEDLQVKMFPHLFSDTAAVTATTSKYRVSH